MSVSAWLTALAVVSILTSAAATANGEAIGYSPSTKTLAVGYRRAPPVGPLTVSIPGREARATATPAASRIVALTLEGGCAGASTLAQVRDALLADPDVRFVYPALIHAQSGQTILPTDQLLMKARPGIDAAEVARRLPPTLAIVKRLNGSDDEYVLRLADPRAADPIAVAADLAGEPWVAWAEPDFIREYTR